MMMVRRKGARHPPLMMNKENNNFNIRSLKHRDRELQGRRQIAVYIILGLRIAFRS